MTVSLAKPLPFHRLAAIFDIRPGEGRVVFLLVLLAACLGFTRQFTQTAAGTLFLLEFNVTSLPFVYIGVALIVPTVGFLYSTLERWLALPRLQMLNLGLHLVVLGVLWYCLYSFPTSEIKAPTYILAVWYEAVWAFTGLAVWSLAGRLFNVRQAKRLFGLIAAGDVLAAMLSGFVTELWVKLAGTTSLLIGALVALVGALALVIYLDRHYGRALRGATQEDEETGDAAAKTTDLQGQYARLILTLAVVSYIAFYFVDNIFYTEVARQFASSEAALAGFLGVFWAVVNLVTLILNLTVVGPLTNRLGVRVGLFTLPISLLGMAVALAVAGWRGDVMLIFWFAVGSNFFDWLFSETLYKSAQQILYQPLPTNARSQLQTNVESFAQPVAQGVAGLLLLGLGLLAFDVLLQNYVLFGLLLAWLALVIRLGRDYSKVLTQALAKRRLGQGVTLSDPNSIALLRENLDSPRPGPVIYALDLLEKGEHPALKNDLLRLLTHDAPLVREDVCRRLERLQLREVAPTLRAHAEQETDPAVRGVAVRAWIALDDEDVVDDVAPYITDPDPRVREGVLVGLLKNGSLAGVLTAGERFTELWHSPLSAERLNAARILGEVGNRQFYRPLLDLCKDPDVQVRRAALLAAGRINSPRLWPHVMQGLATNAHAEAAFALVNGGASVFPEIKAALEQADLSSLIRKRLMRVLGRVGTPASIQLLLAYLQAPVVAVRQEALLALTRRNYRATTPAETQQVLAVVRFESAQATRLLAALGDVAPLTHNELLNHTLHEMLADVRLRMLQLLAFVYPTRTLLQVRDSLAKESSEQRAYAIETLDTLLAQDLKPYIIPLVDELPPAAKLERLQTHFPQERLEASLRLHTLWRTADASETWLQANVVYALTQNALPLDPLGLAPKELKAMLNLVERVLILKTVNLFSSSPDSVVADVASLLEETELPKGEKLFDKGEAGTCMYIIVSGKVKVHDGQRFLNFLDERKIVGEMAVLDAAPRLASVTAEEDTLLLRLDQEALYELMADRIEVARGIIKVLTGTVRDRLNDISDLREQLEIAKASANRMQERVWTRLKL